VIVAFKLNQTFNDPNVSLYEATRKRRRIDKKKIHKIEYVFATYKWVVRGIFIPNTWIRDDRKGKWMFEWEEVTDSNITSLYLDKQINELLTWQQWVRYFYPAEEDAKRFK